MRAVLLTRFGGPEVLELHDMPDPEPGPGEVAVRVAAASVNNTDVWTRSGAYGVDEPAGWLGPVDFPRVPGADVCGRVDQVGAGVPADLLGRRVLVDPVVRYSEGPEPLVAEVLGSEADGGYAERVLVAADRVHDVTDSPLSDEQLACLPISYGTATGMLERGRIRAGETLLDSGASGGVGLALVGLAAARGARVVALSSGSKAAAVREAGADVVIDRHDGDVAAQLGDLVPEGLDAVTDVVGGSTCARCRCWARRCTRQHSSRCSSAPPTPARSTRWWPGPSLSRTPPRRRPSRSDASTSASWSWCRDSAAQQAPEPGVLLGVGVPAAPLPRGDGGLDGGDVLAAAGPGRLATGPAGDGSAHESNVSPQGDIVER